MVEEPVLVLGPRRHPKTGAAQPFAEAVQRLVGKPDLAVLESLRPGFRTGRGLVVARALVSVNRRP